MHYRIAKINRFGIKSIIQFTISKTPLHTNGSWNNGLIFGKTTSKYIKIDSSKFSLPIILMCF